MLDMFKRPDDPPEYNQLFAIPGAAMLATYAAGHFTGDWGGAGGPLGMDGRLGGVAWVGRVVALGGRWNWGCRSM